MTVAVLYGAVGARGTTARAASWGTFAHIATGDLTSDAVRQSVAQSYDTIALRGNLDSALLADLHQRRSGIVLLAYEKAAGLNNTETNDFLTNHPDWLARDAARGLIHPTGDSNTTLGDLTNAAFRSWSASKFASEVSLGADGAFVDTLGAYFPPDFYTARPVVNGQPVTDAAWRDGSVDLISRIKTATNNKLVVINGFGLGSGAAYYAAMADADQLINVADGVQIESFTRTRNADPSTYRSADKWDQDLAFLESLAPRNKLAFAYTKVKSGASSTELTTLRDYALASFLLAFTPGRGSIGFDDGSRIPAVPSDAAWARDLGSPAGSRSRAGTDGWSRSFANGLLTLHAGGAPVVDTSRRSTTFTGSGINRTEFTLTVGSGPLTATLTYSGTSYKTVLIRQGATYFGGTPKTGTNPLVVQATVAAGTYVFGVQGGADVPYTLRVDSSGGATPSSTTAATTTSTTRPSTTTTSTTRPTTTTTTSTTRPSARQTATFTGSSATRTEFNLTVGAGPVTATLTFGGGGYKTLMLRQGATYLGGTPKTGTSPVVVQVTLTAGTYTFGVQGGTAVPYTLTVDYPV